MGDFVVLLITLVAIFVLVVVILPEFPRWVRVGFWLGITILNVIYDDALFAAITAAYVMIEWYSDERRS